jgi:branched-chain amino acid transport system substrate-binding protein
MSRSVRSLLPALVAGGLLMAACAETETTATTAAPESVPAAETTAAPAPETTAAPAPETTTVSGPSAAEQWALDYVGGTSGSASGDAVKIGWASSSDFFPESDVAAEAVATYVNEKLGGIGGRPMELVKCAMSVPEDGAKCGAQFANDDSIVMVVSGQSLVGAADLYTALQGKKPVYTAAPLGIDDFLSQVTVSYFSGALGAGMGVASFMSSDITPKSIAFVITDDAAGRGGYAVLEPIMKRAGAELRPIFVQPTATAPEVEAALQAVQVETAEAIGIGLFEQGCIAAYDALKNLGIDATAVPVVAVAPCRGPAVQEHLKSVGDTSLVPNGWYFTGGGYNLFTGNAESGTDAFIDILTAAGRPEVVFTVGSEEIVGGLMTMVKHLNAAAGDYSFATVDGLIRGFEGPVMATAGTMICGQPTLFKGVCATKVGMTRYLDGKWEDTRVGDNAIDIQPFLVSA